MKEGGSFTFPGDTELVKKTPFLCNFNQFKTLARFLNSNNLEFEQNQFVIESGCTSYMVKTSQEDNAPNSQKMVFSYYEDAKNYMRVDMSTEQLTQILDNVLFKMIRQLHSYYISYRSVIYTSTENKIWYGENEDTCSSKQKKKPATV